MNDYEIKKLYEEMEMYLIQSMKRNLGRHLTEENKVGFQFTQWQAEKLKELKRYQRENQKIIGRYTLGLDKDVSEHLQNELKQGAINAIKQYSKISGYTLTASKIMNKSFFKTNDKKVKALIKAVNNDLKTANTSALRMINDQYRQIIHKSAFFVANGVFTEKQAAAQATKEIRDQKMAMLAVDEASKPFLAGGLNCIEYKDGRRVNIASYSQMAIRTASLRAQLMGEGDFRKSIGRTLVKVTTHGGACPLCVKWQGKILIDDVYSGGTSKDGNYTLLSEAMKQNFLHPNCRHGITTYYPELEEDDDVIEPVSTEMEETQQQLNYAVRNVKKYNRLKSGSLDKENINKYSNKYIEWSSEADLWGNEMERLKELSQKPLDLSKYKRGSRIRKEVLKEIDMDHIHINLNGMSDDYANDIQEQLKYLNDKYNNNLIDVAYSDKVDKAFGDIHMAETTGPKYWKKIQLNGFGDSEEFNEMLKNQIKRGHQVEIAEKNYGKYLITHEFGHSITLDAIPKSKLTKIEEIQRQYSLEYHSLKHQIKEKSDKWILDIGNETLSKEIQDLSKQLDDIKISEYALRNTEEFMAECFVDVELGTNTSKYSKEVYDIILNENKKWKFSLDENLNAPNVIEQVIKKQSHITTEQKYLFKKYINDIDITDNPDKFMYFHKSKNKIFVNPNYKDIDYYDFNSSLSHEMGHMLDYRNNFVKDNQTIIDEYINKSQKFILKDKQKYLNLFKEERYKNNMTLSDLFSAITNGEIQGNYSHSKAYWMKPNKIQSESIANILNVYLTKDVDSLKIISEIPELTDLYREVLKWYEKIR